MKKTLREMEKSWRARVQVLERDLALKHQALIRAKEELAELATCQQAQVSQYTEDLERLKWERDMTRQLNEHLRDNRRDVKLVVGNVEVRVGGCESVSVGGAK